MWHDIIASYCNNLPPSEAKHTHLLAIERHNLGQTECCLIFLEDHFLLYNRMMLGIMLRVGGIAALSLWILQVANPAKA